MRKSKTLAKIRSHQVAKICCLGHYIPSFISHAAHFGYDCIWLDLEHRRMTERDVEALLAFFHRFDIDCLLRAPTLEKSRLYAYLEDGAAGLMIPHVSTPEKAQMLADSVKFPPLGDRGLDGAGFDGGYFLDDQKTYPEQANQETLLVVQIETIEAVENADAIAAVPGVDGLFVGPGDLSLRLRNSDTSMTLDDAQKTVAEAAARHGKAWGRPASTPEQIEEFSQMGAQLIAYGGEYLALMNMLRTCAADFDSALERK